MDILRKELDEIYSRQKLYDELLPADDIARCRKSFLHLFDHSDERLRQADVVKIYGVGKERGDFLISEAGYSTPDARYVKCVLVPFSG